MENFKIKSIGQFHELINESHDNLNDLKLHERKLRHIINESYVDLKGILWNNEAEYRKILEILSEAVKDNTLAQKKIIDSLNL